MWWFCSTRERRDSGCGVCVYLSLQPVGRGEDGRGGVDGCQLVCVRLHPHSDIVHHTQQVVHHLHVNTSQSWNLKIEP